MSLAVSVHVFYASLGISHKDTGRKQHDVKNLNMHIKMYMLKSGRFLFYVKMYA